MKPKKIAGEIFVGTSGWNYKESKGIFYHEKLKAAEYLPFYSREFKATEINTSFYHMPRMTTVQGWIEKVPPTFKFCVKISKYITHIKRLKEPEEPLARFFEVFTQMKDLMGPVLIQLPPSLKFDYDIAEYFFKELRTHYKEYDYTLEVRHDSWLSMDSLALLAKYSIGLVISQSGVGFPYAEVITDKNIFMRFHGPGKLYASSYTDEDLNRYADKFMDWKQKGYVVWAFFNNGWKDAINNALTLKRIVTENEALQK